MLLPNSWKTEIGIWRDPSLLLLVLLLGKISMTKYCLTPVINNACVLSPTHHMTHGCQLLTQKGLSEE